MLYGDYTETNHRKDGKKLHTNARPKIRRSLHLDVQILIHLADNLYCVTNSEMRILSICVSTPFI